MPEIADMMAVGLDWFAGQFKRFASHTVTYRGIRNGVMVEAELAVSVGSSQPVSINSLGMEQSIADFTVANPLEVDRDIIVQTKDMMIAGLWPPKSGDFVDDASGVGGITKRYQCKGIPGQSVWRPLRGGYDGMVRVHTKFYALIQTYWRDT